MCSHILEQYVHDQYSDGLYEIIIQCIDNFKLSGAIAEHAMTQQDSLEGDEKTFNKF